MTLSRFGDPNGFSMLRTAMGSPRGERPMEIEEMERLPGLFRRWELPLILTAGADYRLEDAGGHADGAPLLAIYRRRDDATGTAS